MKLLYDFFPILLFFLVYKFYGIYPATAVAIIAVVAQVSLTLARGKRPEVMNLITLAMVVVLGGATLIFKNEMFIKWKPTAVYWVLGIVFAASGYVGQKNLVQKLLEQTLALPQQAWITLNRTWYGFFFIMGCLNLVIVYSFDTNTWVNFKLFGTLILTLLFAVVQAFLVSRYLPNTEQRKNSL